jgi:prepilin-type processing-associated H-X9-DG protein
MKKLLAAKTFHQVGRTSNTHARHTRSTVFARHARKNQLEEGRKDIEEEWEENQENGRRRKPHFQTATFTPFSDWRSDAHLGLGTKISWQIEVFENEVKVPSEMFAIGESRYANAQANSFPGGAGGLDRLECGIGTYSSPFDSRRHGKKYNQLFCDGHVSAMNPMVLFNPTNTASMWNYDHEPHPETWRSRLE